MILKHYRKIYEENFGKIPKDDNGITYDVHHIDGNNKNNDINNLLAVSLEHHYQIHLYQGDYAAANKILYRMQLDREEFLKQCSITATLENKKRVKNGTHNFLNKQKAKETSDLRFLRGDHPFLRHNFHKNITEKRVKDKTHHFFGGDIQRNLILKRIKEGTHPSQIITVCPNCNKSGPLTVMGKSHKSKCIGLPKQ